VGGGELCWGGLAAVRSVCANVACGKEVKRKCSSLVAAPSKQVRAFCCSCKDACTLLIGQRLCVCVLVGFTGRLFHPTFAVKCM